MLYLLVNTKCCRYETKMNVTVYVIQNFSFKN